MNKSIETSLRYPGSALILTVLAIATMVTLALGIAQLVPKDFRQSEALSASMEAEAAALAGVEHALFLLHQGQGMNHFFELSQNMVTNPRNHPFGQAPTSCLQTARICPGIDRLLGIPERQTPYQIDSRVLNTTDLNYQLVVWHRRINSGNTEDPSLNDLLSLLPTDPLLQFPNNVNINPVLARDEVKRLDLRGVTTIALNWKVVGFPSQSLLGTKGCDVSPPATEAKLAYIWLKEDGGAILAGDVPRADTRGVLTEQKSVVVSRPPEAAMLSLRFLISNSQDEQKVHDCYVRYNLKNNPGETADLGYDVVESIGVSGGVRRKIRVLVSRENGRVLNILDFGVACETCNNLSTYR